ncbi:MAG: methylated-DNA--[protein]-cysteine S-methyltransferase [Gammaproteobacteria bacterium]|nr:methylated-DNA--[protein]-cysteine S-methyltransferase [Gammaproteobacteria bacterium]
MTTYYCYYDSPIGSLLLAGDGKSIQWLGFPDGSMVRRHEDSWKVSREIFTEAIEQLDQYFAGERQGFELALSLRGTEFQKTVWQALIEIPYGETWSYGQLAKYIGRPKAFRAVGAANGVNPLPVIVPCHRVIGSNGRLTGFGGGLETKAFLLELESQRRSDILPLV